MLHADLSGLPPIMVYYGAFEMLAGEAIEFAKRAKDSGVDVTLRSLPEGQHNFILGAGRGPEVDCQTGWQVGHAWAERTGSARAQARNWAPCGARINQPLCTVGLALVISAGRAEVTPHILEVDCLNDARAANPPTSAASDAQIAYFLARFMLYAPRVIDLADCLYLYANILRR
jgi:acetyl esterase/lipase